MNDKIKLIIEYKKDKSDALFMKIVERMNQLIKYHVNKISSTYREDLYQEMLISLDEAINVFEINENIKVESELFNYDNLLKIKKLKYKHLNQIMHGKYFEGFIAMYGKSLFESAFNDKTKLEELIYEYKLFCNENQLIEYLKSTFKNRRISFYREHVAKPDSTLISLNTPIGNDIELIDIIPDNYHSVDESILYYESLSSEENEFLNMFYERDRVLTETEVAKRLGVSQQAVSKRKRRILRKLYYKK